MPFLLGYAKCPNLVHKTCGSEFEITPRARFSETPELRDCENSCNEDDECKFFYKFTAAHINMCLRYRSCDTIRHATQIGSTYSKEHNCPIDEKKPDESRN